MTIDERYCPNCNGAIDPFDTVCPHCFFNPLLSVHLGENAIIFTPRFAKKSTTVLDIEYTKKDQPRSSSKHSPKSSRNRATDHQREIFKILFAGGVMGKYGDRYRVWDRSRAPKKRFGLSTFLHIKKYCKPQDGGFAIDTKKVEAMRSDAWLKQYFLTIKNKFK